MVHFQFTNWPTNGVTASLQTVLDVLEFIGRVQRRSGKRPVVVHCRYDQLSCGDVIKTQHCHTFP